MIIRILLTKIGIDAHDRGIKVVARMLRDAGMEVVYTGPWQNVDSVASIAVQEDVQVIGISTLGGDYVLVPKLLECLKEEGLDIPVIIGGIIPADVEEGLKKLGIAYVFHPGTKAESMVSQIESVVRDRKDAAESKEV